MLINLRNALMAGKRTPTAKDYVQNGLVAMWDGIENAGWGVHDTNATEWKDLIGLNNLSIGNDTSKAYFGDNFMHRSAALGNLLTKFVFGFPCTVRMTLAVDEDIVASSNPRFFSLWASGISTRREFDIYSSIPSTGPRLYQPIAYGRFGRSAATGLWAISVVMSDNSSVAISDESCGKELTTSLTAYQTEVFGINIGAWSNQSSAMSAKYYNIAIYSRALTAAEIAANYAIDKARFGLP